LSHVAAGHSAFDSCEKIYDSASLGYQKPDHRFYRVIEADFQLPTNRILMIGDNAIGDFIAPKILGWQAYWLSQNSTFVLEHLLESFRQGTSIDI
jgi:FMN phosphatase YigB (HAD superfamily)